MKKRFLALTMAALTAASLLTGCGSSSGSSAPSSSAGGGAGSEAQAAPGDVISLRMAQASAQDGAIGQSMEKFAADVKEKTGGKVEIVVYHNGQLGTERDNVEACQLNNLDIAVVNNSVLANFIPWFAALDLPYIIEGTDHADKVFLGEVGQEMLTSMEDIGVKGVGIWESGFRNLTNSKKDINSVDDVAGLRIRVMENKVHQALWQALGADPVPMAWSDAYTGMQQGAIDGQENPTTVIDKNNVVEVNKKMAITEHVYSTVSIIMSKKSWESLGEENQKIFMECMKSAELNERELSRQMDEEALKVLEEKGMVITRPEKDAFIEKTQSVRDEYGKDYADIVTKIQAAK